MNDQLSLGWSLAPIVRLPARDPVEDDLCRCAEQDDGVELVVELALIPHTRCYLSRQDPRQLPHELDGPLEVVDAGRLRGSADRTWPSSRTASAPSAHGSVPAGAGVSGRTASRSRCLRWRAAHERQPTRARHRQRRSVTQVAGLVLDGVATIREGAEIRGCHVPHMLRHGAATLLLAAGVPDTVALEVMGHADTRILRHYQEVVGDLKRDAAAKMDAILGKEA
jgi:hypothetical protein